MISTIFYIREDIQATLFEFLLIFQSCLDDNFSRALLVLRFSPNTNLRSERSSSHEGRRSMTHVRLIPVNADWYNLFDAVGGYQDHFLEKQPLADDHVFDLTLLISDNIGYPGLANVAFA